MKTWNNNTTNTTKEIMKKKFDMLKLQSLRINKSNQG